MGIEPTLSAWEAEVLPLNYTRSVPEGKTHFFPGWNCTSSPPDAIYKPVMRQITGWKSARFRVEAIISSSVPTVTSDAPLPCYRGLNPWFGRRFHDARSGQGARILRREVRSLQWASQFGVALGMGRPARLQ